LNVRQPEGPALVSSPPAAPTARDFPGPGYEVAQPSGQLTALAFGVFAQHQSRCLEERSDLGALSLGDSYDGE
jgi:hypothetical protein